MNGYTAELTIDDDMKSGLCLPAYSGTIEILFKKSEHIKQMTLWHWSTPAGTRSVTIYGLKNNQWQLIGEQTDDVPYEVVEFQVALTEGDYTGVRLNMSFSKSWVNIYEMMLK